MPTHGFIQNLYSPDNRCLIIARHDCIMLRVLAIVAALIFVDANWYHGRMLVRPVAEALVYGSDALHRAAYRVGM